MVAPAVGGARSRRRGAAGAHLLRRSDAALWAILLAVVVRLLLDPAANTWYLVGLETVGLVAAADLCTGRLAAMRGEARRTQPA
jgi:hypothetical protein